MPMVIEDIHLFVIQMMCYIFIKRMTILCTGSKWCIENLSLPLFNIKYLVLYDHGYI